MKFISIPNPILLIPAHYQPLANESSTLKQEDVDQYLAENVYNHLNHRNPIATISCQIKDNSAALMKEPFSLQLMQLLGFSDPENNSSTVKIGALVALGLELGANNPNLNIHPAHVLAKKLILRPEVLIPTDTSQIQQNNTKAILINIKKDLELIYYLARRRPSTLKNQTKQILSALFSQLDVCGPGLLASLTVIKGDLQITDFYSWLEKFKMDLISEFHAILMVRHHHSPGSSIHLLVNMTKYAESMSFKVSNLYKISTVDDRFIGTINFSKDDKQDFFHYLKENYTLARIVSRLKNDIEKEFKQACNSLNIAINNEQYISYNKYTQLMSGHVASILKKHFVFDSSEDMESEIPNSCLETLHMDIYDIIAEYKIEFVEFAQSTTSIEASANTITIRPIDEHSSLYIAKFKAKEREFKVRLTKEFAESLRINPAPLIPKLAESVGKIRITNIEYHIIKNLYKNNSSNSEFSTIITSNPTIPNKKYKLHYLTLEEGFAASLIYVEHQGEVISFPQLDANTMKEIITMADDEAKQIILQYCVQNGNLELFKQILQMYKFQLSLLESLYLIAFKYKYEQIIVYMIEQGISIKMENYQALMQKFNPQVKMSFCDVIINVLGEWRPETLFKFLINKHLIDEPDIIIFTTMGNTEQKVELFNSIYDKLDYNFNPKLTQLLLELILELNDDASHELLCKILASRPQLDLISAIVKYHTLSQLSNDGKMTTIKLILKHYMADTRLQAWWSSKDGGLNVMCPLMRTLFYQVDKEIIVLSLAAGAILEKKINPRKRKNPQTIQEFVNNSCNAEIRNIVNNPLLYAIRHCGLPVVERLLAQARYANLPKDGYLRLSIESGDMDKIIFCIRQNLLPTDGDALCNILAEIINKIHSVPDASMFLIEIAKACFLKAPEKYRAQILALICNKIPNIALHLIEINFIDIQTVKSKDFNIGFIDANKNSLFNYLLNITLPTDINSLNLVIEFISQAQADVNLNKIDFLIMANNTDQNTPLHIAVMQNLPTVIRQLIPYYARLDCKNDQGKTALQLATDLQFHDIIKIITDECNNRTIFDSSYEEPLIPLAEVNIYDESKFDLALANMFFNVNDEADSRPQQSASKRPRLG